jgi:hypothetical protein
MWPEKDKSGVKQLMEINDDSALSATFAISVKVFLLYFIIQNHRKLKYTYTE